MDLVVVQQQRQRHQLRRLRPCRGDLAKGGTREVTEEEELLLRAVLRQRVHSREGGRRGGEGSDKTTTAATAASRSLLRGNGNGGDDLAARILGLEFVGINSCRRRSTHPIVLANTDVNDDNDNNIVVGSCLVYQGKHTEWDAYYTCPAGTVACYPPTATAVAYT